MQPKKKSVATILQMIITDVQHLLLVNYIVMKTTSGSLKPSEKEHMIAVFQIWQKDINKEGDKVTCQ